MPECRKCGKYFPNRVEIGGIIKNLQGRKYCLDCSPFEAHNVKKLEQLDYVKVDSNGKTIHVCSVCSRQFIPNRSKGLKGKFCNSCVSNRKRFELKIKCINYKGGKCEVCGYSKCVAALVFHHTDASEKDFSIGGNHCRAWNTVKNELDKCSLLCANCHHEIHFESSRENKSRIIEELVRKPKIKQLRYCKNCGELCIDEYCSQKCYNLSRRLVIRPSLEQLKKEVEEFGYCAVGRKYGVSDNAIRKWEKQLYLETGEIDFQI